eukprot:GHVU01000976.1.p1 GENE.GHVU01000976.1~~GHVU01000976.1.p1  ORF type:complete len:429 (+),score=56.15 GHVU01000976.1:103-1389(+)
MIAHFRSDTSEVSNFSLLINFRFCCDMSDLPKVVFIGETGAGKSTLVNVLAVVSRTLEFQGLRPEVQAFSETESGFCVENAAQVALSSLCIPMRYDTEAGERTFGPLGNNESMNNEARAGTLSPSTYELEFITAIDTPGLNDPDTPDDSHLASISDILTEAEGGVTAFVFVLKASNNRHRRDLAAALKQLLQSCGKRFLERVYWVFTHPCHRGLAGGGKRTVRALLDDLERTANFRVRFEDDPLQNPNVFVVNNQVLEGLLLENEWSAEQRATLFNQGAERARAMMASIGRIRPIYLPTDVIGKLRECSAQLSTYAGDIISIFKRIAELEAGQRESMAQKEKHEQSCSELKEHVDRDGHRRLRQLSETVEEKQAEQQLVVAELRDCEEKLAASTNELSRMEGQLDGERACRGALLKCRHGISRRIVPV